MELSNLLITFLLLAVDSTFFVPPTLNIFHFLQIKHYVHIHHNIG